MPYPAFIQVDELPDVFFAGLPGVRGKQLAGNPQTRRSSRQILLPADWQFTTGASPNLSVELFVLAGEIGLADLTLGPGGYAYIPPGSAGLQMRSEQGAMLLYFLDDADPAAVIGTPLITNSDLIEWRPAADAANVHIKELRVDPGSGARTWMLRMQAGVPGNWSASTVATEGYLLAGRATHSECVNGTVVSGSYSSGGYFHRIPGAVHGESRSIGERDAIWLMRVLTHDAQQAVASCAAES